MDARGIPPTFPFHVAKAYAPQAPAARRAAAGSASPSPDSAEFTKPRSQAISSLVGGKVGVPPNFTPGATADTGALPLYRHPADKNAAATGVSLGRAVDVLG